MILLDKMDADISDAKPEIAESFVQNAAEALGISILPEDAMVQILQEVNYRVKEFVEQAKKFMEHGRRHKLSAEDFDRVLRMKNVEPLYGFSASDSVPFRFSSGGGRDVFVQEDREVDLNQILNAPVPKAPLEIQMKVDGVQPAIPENPVQLSEMDDGDSGQGGEGRKRLGRRFRRTEVVQVRSSTTHDLSAEQQLYFKEVTEACVGGDESKRAEALQSLATDTGLSVILSRLVLFVSEGVKCNVVQHNLALLIYLMRLMKSLVDNPSVSLEKYLHDLLPAMLSCILSKRLCSKPEYDNHWALRDFAARLLDRVTRVVCGAWENDDTPPAMLYGALSVLSEMGSRAMEAFVIPKVLSLADKIRLGTETAQYTGFDKKDERKDAFEHLQKALIKSLAQYVKSMKPSGLLDVADYRKMFGTLGMAVYQQISTGSRPGSVSSSSSSRPTTPNTQKFPTPQHYIRQTSYSTGPPTPRFMVRSSGQTEPNVQLGEPRTFGPPPSGPL